MHNYNPKEREKMEQNKLPTDIIKHEILVRLPPKSLKRFQCVCKPWFSIISDPQFVRQHLNYLPKTKLILSPDPPCQNKSLHSVDYDSALVGDDDIDVVENVNSPVDFHVNVLGSCDGLVIIGDDDYEKIHCWNPSTKQLKDLTCSGTPWDSNVSYTLNGFFRDKTADDYNLLLIHHVISPPVSPSKVNEYCDGDEYAYETISVYIYSLRTNRWSQMEHLFPFRAFTSQSATLINGLPHWMVRCDTGVSSIHLTNKIIYFDVSDNKFKEISFTKYRDVCSIFLGMGVLDGCLSVIDRSNKGRAEVWTMKEYGVEESWTNLFNISFSSPEEICFRYLKPLCFTKSGEVLIQGGRRTIMAYDPQEENVRNIGLGTSNKFTAALYVESLISPNVEFEAPQKVVEKHKGKRVARRRLGFRNKTFQGRS